MNIDAKPLKENQLAGKLLEEQISIIKLEDTLLPIQHLWG
jgi:hypothetical protein